MNDIFNPYTNFSLVYIDDVLIFSNFLEQHFKHLETFQKIVKENGLVISAPKIKLFQTRIRFLGFEIYQGTIKPIHISIEFGSMFPDEIKDKTQLQRFLGSLNYVSDFYPNIRTTIKPLTRLGLNKPVCACLKDARHNNFDDSLLGIIESNMAHGPVYFNCFLFECFLCLDFL